MWHKSALLVVVIILSLQTIALAEDDIYLRFRQAQLGDEYRFWYGEGTLKTDFKDDFVVEKGSCEIRHHSSNLIPVEDDEEQIRFLQLNTSDHAEMTFLTNIPDGHGYYSINIVLPKVEENRHLRIEIENGERILYSNLDLNVENWGSYLALEGDTKETHIRIIYLTTLANRLFSNAFAAVLFLGFLLSYSIYKRKQIRRNLRQGFGKIKKDMNEITVRWGWPFRFETEDKGYKLTYIGTCKKGNGEWDEDDMEEKRDNIILP